jgi:hypothetical protein
MVGPEMATRLETSVHLHEENTRVYLQHYENACGLN